MTRTCLTSLTVVVVAGALVAHNVRAEQRPTEPSLSALLSVAGRYVAEYETSFGALVAQEIYQQSTNQPATSASRSPSQPTRRITTGEVLLFDSGGAGWMIFRDIHVLDNKELTVPTVRMAALASEPTRQLLANAMRATARVSSYMIGEIPRSPATPTAALMYLRPARQGLGVFELDGMKTIDNVGVALLKFSERADARMSTADDSTTTGRFWIDPDTGRVVQTEITIASAAYTTKVEVQYAVRPGVSFPVPVRMFETHRATVTPRGMSSASFGRTGGGSTQTYIDGLATYQGFQRFELKPELIVR